MKEIVGIFQAYTGSGFLTILYLLILLYLWISETNGTLRAILVYGAGVIQLLFFLPLFYYGYRILDQSTYYRILWILPMTVTISYGCVKFLTKNPKAGVWIAAALLIVSGKYVYSNEYITPAENPYHIPQEVIEVCDMIMPGEEEERITGVFPDDLIHFVRQYTTRIQMPYGREYLAAGWGYGEHPLRSLLKGEQIRISQLISLATEYKCHYIIMEKGKKLIGDPQKAGMTLVGETADHDIYRNNRIEIEKKVIND